MTDVISRILIRCPNTGEPVETVLRMRASAFEALKGDYSFRCPRCAQVHVWGKGEAWLEEAGRRHM